MSGATRVQLSENEDWNREPSQEELANAPALTHAEMVQVMKSPEYKNSRLVQKLVAASLSKGQASSESAEPVQSSDEFLAKRETVMNMMRDPRYKHDAAYRWETQQKIAALTQQDGTLSPGDLSTPNQTVSVGLSSSPYRGTDLTVRKFARYETPVNLTGPDAPVKPVKQTPEELANS